MDMYGFIELVKYCDSITFTSKKDNFPIVEKTYSTSDLEQVISELDKRIPRTATETQELMDIEYVCPTCQCVNDRSTNFCWKCGQALRHW